MPGHSHFGLQQVRERVLQAGNGTYSDAERATLADSIRGLRDDLLAVANRDDGAGRYLYVERPTSGEAVVMDFNRAYTPPCGFTPYATCPLPPRSNWLPIAIRAGERTPPGHP